MRLLSKYILFLLVITTCIGFSFTPTYAVQETSGSEDESQKDQYTGSMLIGTVRSHIASADDTLAELAKQYEVGYVEILAANQGIDPWLPGEGTEIIIPDKHLLPTQSHEGIVVNLGEMRMYYYKTPGESPQTYPLGIGREGLSTPMGTTSIVRKKEGPQWRPTPRMRKLDPSLPEVVEAGEDNPLGTHALYLGWPAYLIHGTHKPMGIGRRVSSGCIRMYPDHIVKMYEQVAVDTPVTVVDEPVKIAWVGNDLYLEAQPSAAQADELEFKGGIYTFEWPDGLLGRIRAKAGKRSSDVDWRLVKNTLAQRKGIPVKITTQ